jgi:hypothetical protein
VRKWFGVLSVLVLMVGMSAHAIAEDVAVTIPATGIDWSATMTGIFDAVKPAMIAGIGVGLAIVIVYTAYKFLKRGAHG